MKNSILIILLINFFSFFFINIGYCEDSNNIFIFKDVFKNISTGNSSEKIQANTLPDPWPTGAVVGGNYTIKRYESVAKFKYVKLPDNFTLFLNKDVDRIEWEIDLLEFGQNVTFDISGRMKFMNVYPGPPSDQPPIQGKASWQQKGLNGLKGKEGIKGNNGKPLKLIITNIVPTGSLWIRTDGQCGGTGGKGGAGQQGGDNGACDGMDQSNGGNGGDGGDGGDGGIGGDTSTVEILIKSLPAGYVFEPEACSKNCAATNFAPETGTDGRIIIWGAPGCGGRSMLGSGAFPGAGGPGGGTTYDCDEWHLPWTNIHYTARPGNPGQMGHWGKVGPMGSCGKVVIKGP